MSTAVSAELLPAAAGPMVPAPFQVLSRRQDTADTVTLELAPDLRDDSFQFMPGQFTMLSAGGAGEVPISISGDPDVHGRLIHTVRAVGLATEAICASEPGCVLGVRGPFGVPWPVADVAGADVVIAAGGIGLAPLRPALMWMLARRSQFGRVVLLYGSRNPSQLLYRDQFDEWSDRGLELFVTVDSAGPEWLGHVGVVTRLLERAKLDPSSTIALSCGPEVMMRFTVAGLAALGLPADRIYVSLERNMQCGIGHCGHCQLGPTLICRDGPVYSWSEIERWLAIREL